RVPLRDLCPDPRRHPSGGQDGGELTMRWIIPTENSVESLALSRRGFLRVAGSAGAGLLISIKLGGIAHAERSGAAAAIQGSAEETIDATGFVKIAPNDTVTVVVRR